MNDLVNLGSMMALERERAKGYATGETLRYIELLEQVAYAAVGYWSVSSINEFNEHAQQRWGNLYDALSAVDWMNGE